MAAEHDDPTAPERAREVERDEEQEERKRGGPGKVRLDEDIARRYDPARLSRIVVEGAGRGERLDLATRGRMERLIPGHDFSTVRVFRGPLAEEVTARHRADAVTVAQTGMVLVRESSRSAPGTSSGQALLAHEMTHVAQGQRGMHFSRSGGAEGEGEHEQEAERVEAAALRGDGGAGSEGGGDGHDAERAAARRRAVTERVLEMIAEDTRVHRERNGLDWKR